MSALDLYQRLLEDPRELTLVEPEHLDWLERLWETYKSVRS